MGMADITFLQEIAQQDIIAAQFTEYQGEYVIELEFQFSQLNQREKYWVSLEYGLPLKVESYVGENLIYTAQTQLISKEESPQSMFSFS